MSLRPGDLNSANNGVAGGEFPYWVAVAKSGLVYVSSLRDREIDVVNTTTQSVTRIKVPGNPNRLVLNKAQTQLFVTCDNSDLLVQINTATNKIMSLTRTTAPLNYITNGVTNGASPNSLTLSPDESTAYVTNAAMNAVSVIDLVSEATPRVVGLIPTGWEPTSVSTSADGSMLYIINAQGVTGPNPQYGQTGVNQYDWQLSKAGFLVMPTPSRATLVQLTSIVAKNNHFNYQLSAKTAPTTRYWGIWARGTAIAN
jgi:YVTN family beta-propeller protein